MKLLNFHQKNKNYIILYTLVDSELSDHLIKKAEEFYTLLQVLGELILNFSKILKQNALNISQQHKQ